MLRVVHGCVCSGKTTYVREHIGEDDLVFDFDRLKEALTFRNGHEDTKPGAMKLLMQYRDTFLDNAAETENVCWFITVKLNDDLKARAAEIIHIEATRDECLEHLQNDDTRPNKDVFINLINDYFKEAEMEEKDITKEIQRKLDGGREYRAMSMTVTESENEEDRTVEGYATTFDEPYYLYTIKDKDGNDSAIVYEEVDRNAFADADLSDVIMQYDHQGRVFARLSNNTLSLEEDDHGLKVRAYLGGTELGRQLYDEIKGGYTNKMSFGFTVSKDNLERHANGRDYIRKIEGIKKLYDVSAVSYPQNPFTSISEATRAALDGEIQKLEQERLTEEIRRQERAEKREALMQRLNGLVMEEEKA